MAKSAHVGSSLSIVEILAILYNEILNISPKKKNFFNRDRFILSKGHAALALYCTLYEKNFILLLIIYSLIIFLISYKTEVMKFKLDKKRKNN